jgi:hypothetical protein
LLKIDMPPFYGRECAARRIMHSAERRSAAAAAVEEPMTSPPHASIDVWRRITQTPEIVDYFRGLFRSMAFTVADTGEAFTAVHEGRAITLRPGADPAADFTVPLTRENVERLVAHTHDGRITPDESWRIAAVLFTPLTQATLRNPVMSSNWIRRLAGVEDLIHVRLVGPAGQEEAAHTLIYAARQWVVLPGLHGRATRVYRLTPEQSLDYQRHVFAAMQQDSVAGWWRFARWYRGWRESVSV